jgi:hypothetical protein
MVIERVVVSLVGQTAGALGGSGWQWHGRKPLGKVKRMPLKKKKPPGGQGGFFVVCGADFHRHDFIMHEPCDNFGEMILKKIIWPF